MIDEDGGVIRTRAAIEALIAALRNSLRFDENISVRAATSTAVEVRAGGVTAEHGRVVVCAGRGTAPLARGAGLPLPVRQSVHVRLTYPVRGDAPPVSRACRTEAARSAKSVPIRIRCPATATTPLASETRRSTRTEAFSIRPGSPPRRSAPTRTSAAHCPVSSRGRSTPGTAGSPRCPGARTESSRGRPTGCSSSPATTSSSTLRRSAAPSRAPPSATASRPP
jgi:hypothetical protein